MRACPLVALLLGLVGFLATGCAGSPTPTPVTEASTCVFRGTPNIVLEVGAPDAPGSRRLAVWDIPNDPALWTSQKPSSDALDTFLDEVGRRVGDTSPATLLTRAAAPPTSPREIELNQWLLQNLERLVVPMRCFDAILLARQAERLDMISSPTEVLAFVLRSEDHRRLKVIEYTVNQPGSVGSAPSWTRSTRPSRPAGAHGPRSTTTTSFSKTGHGAEGAWHQARRTPNS